MKILSSRGIDSNSYNMSLDVYKSNVLIGQKVQLVDKLFEEFMKEGKVSIQIPNVISDNFLKIVSNIFYLTSQKVTVEIKRDIFDKGVIVTRDQLKDIIDKCNGRHLIETRKQVLRFFKMPKTVIKESTLLKAYAEMLEPNDPDRLAYGKFIELKKKNMNDLADKIYNVRMLNNIYEPRDQIIDFEEINI
jgi:hypothetical protein